MNDAPTKPQASLDLGEEQASSLSTPTFVVDVALPIPVRHTFTYRVDGSMQSQALRGARVYIPFGKREALGVILRAHEVSLTREQLARTKSIIGVEDGDVLFEESTLRTLERAADYYLSPIGEVLKGATPAIASQELRAWKKNSVGKQPKNAAKKKVEIVSLRVQTDALREPRGKHQTRILAVMRERPSIDARELMKLVGCQRAVLSKMETLLWLEIRTTYVWDDPFFSEPVERDVAPTLTAEQSLALSHLHDSIAARAFASHLVLGATGSGKTEVYLGAIAATLVQGRGALLLLPEIGLTPQLIRKVRARFGDDIAVLHSGLGDRDRALHWHKLRSGQVRLAVGARSAVFAPVRDLGLIVVDEEHDSSYKQEEGFRYHGRDVALLRAQECSAVVVLGSATPSLETFHLAQTGKHSLLRMRSRPTARPLPRVDIVDLARMGQGPSREPLLSAPLHRAIERALAASEQTILFLNRRGFAPSLRCETCGAIQSCPACSVSLTEHRSRGERVCHYCEFTQPRSYPCGSCRGVTFESIGLGTERLENIISHVFPNARVQRIDRDTATPRTVDAAMKRVHMREVDIVVGTQMITKGHDLPWVTTVGVLLADQSLSFPDFRASERTFQLLTQVAGRAGRGEREGTVYVQTYQPDHFSVRCAQRHDFDAFADEEMRHRRELRYPPYGRMVAIRLDGLDLAELRVASMKLVESLAAHPSLQAGLVDVMGPAKAPIEKVRSRFRYRILLRSQQRAALHELARAFADKLEKLPTGIRGSVDVDPVSML